MQKHPSILGVNVFFLILVALLVGFSFVTVPLGWRVTINELVIILLPLIVYLVVARLQVRETLQLRPATWSVLAVSFVTGLGIYLFDRWLIMLVTQLTGYQAAYTPELLEGSPLNSILMVIGLTILAPLIEEAVFRGLIQSAYARWGGAAAVIFPAVLFMLFHMSPEQTLFIGLLALGLGWLAWRTESLWPAVAMHFGNNLLAGITVLVTEFAPQTTLPADSLISAGIGLLLAVGGGVVLHRIMPRRTVEKDPAERRQWLLKLSPLVIAVPLTFGMVLLTAVMGIFPEVLSFGMDVQLNPVAYEETQTWTYDILNPADESVGTAACTLTPDADTTTLACDVSVEAFEVTIARSYWKQSALEEELHVTWDSETMALIEGEITGIGQRGDPYEIRIEPAAGEQLQMTITEAGETTETLIPQNSVIGGGRTTSLAVGEWPWRFTAMPLNLLMAREVTVITPLADPAEETVTVVVRTADLFPTTTGEVTAWRVDAGDHYTAWYSVDEPFTLIGYSDDMVTWVLED